MLTGPQNGTDYFSESFRGGFPTPNESSLRTGLTPGGGGSMFPAPSPNSQALFNLQSGGATPSTLDFHRTALNAAQQAKYNLPVAGGSTSQPQEAVATTAAPHGNSFPAQPQLTSSQQQQQQQQPQPGRDVFASNHDVNTAANDLLQFSSGARNGQFAVPGQPNHVNTNIQMQNHSADASPVTRRGTKGSIATSMSGSVEPADQSESGQSEHTKPAGKARGSSNKKSANGKAQNSRRKADETPVKTPANKKLKSNGGGSIDMNMDDDDDDESDDETSPKMEGENGKKMTDEEKRKNFLERNRYVFFCFLLFLVFA